MAIVALADRRWKFSRKLKEPDMAKEPKQQQTIDGAADKPTERVKKAAMEHAKACYWYHKYGEDLKVTKPALDKVMDEDKVEKLEVTISEGGESTRYKIKRSEVAATTKIVCEKQDE